MIIGKERSAKVALVLMCGAVLLYVITGGA